MHGKRGLEKWAQMRYSLCSCAFCSLCTKQRDFRNTNLLQRKNQLTINTPSKRMHKPACVTGKETVLRLLVWTRAQGCSWKIFPLRLSTRYSFHLTALSLASAATGPRLVGTRSSSALESCSVKRNGSSCVLFLCSSPKSTTSTSDSSSPVLLVGENLRSHPSPVGH